MTVRHVIATLSTLAVAVGLLLKAGWISLAVNKAEMRRFFAYCLPIAGGSVLLLLGERLDQILISQWENETAFGLYVVAAAPARPAATT